MKKLRWPPDFNDAERGLDTLEPSWADFAHGVRTRLRFVRDGTAAEKVLGWTLEGVRLQFDAYKARFESGDEPALFEALMFALEQVVPAPYWVSLEAQRRWGRVWDEAVTLHEAFGLESQFPSRRGKKADNSRELLQDRFRLWRRTTDLMRAERLRFDPAIRRVLAEAKPKFPFSLTKAKRLFKEQDWIQGLHLGLVASTTGTQALSRKRKSSRNT